MSLAGYEVSLASGVVPHVICDWIFEFSNCYYHFQEPFGKTGNDKIFEKTFVSHSLHCVTFWSKIPNKLE